MILCVNLNAAVDKTAIVPDFHLGGIHRPQEVMALAGGKGCNVARAIKSLGGESVVTGWVGGYSGQLIEEHAKREGLGTAFVHTQSESRTCLSILDPVNQTLTELYESGNPVSAEELGEFIDGFRHGINQCSAVTLSGTLPPAVAPDFYALLIEIANAASVPTLLDTCGEALALGIRAKPTIAKPNEIEFEELIGKNLETLDEWGREAATTAQRYETTLVVSLGARGALATRGNQIFHAQPPQVNVVSAVGSGDALMAGLAMGIAESRTLQDSLRQGVAAGTANAMTLGAGVFTEQEFRRVFGDTVVREIQAEA